MALGSKGSEELTRALADAVLCQVRHAAPHLGAGDITLTTSLYELGLDSLARMDVVNRLEQSFRVRFTEESLYDMETCRDLIEYLEAQGASVPLDRQSITEPAPDAAWPEAADLPQVLPEHYDVTQFPECKAMRERLATAAASGLDNPFFRAKDRVDGATATIARKQVVSYTSFDYLGMARNLRVIGAAKRALDQFGASASASRLVGGNNTILRQLDDAIARFLGTEAAVVFPSGFGTNESVLGHLFGAEDLILHDELAHASMVQGSLLSRAQRRSFPHNDFAFLDRLLGDVRGSYRRVVIAIEGVYSMDGDYPDLPRFLEVKRRHKAMLYVDEAHSIGVMGSTGRGICEHFGVAPAEGDLWMGTISKALGSTGGYIAGPEILLQYLKYTTPAFVFATALSPANAAAALAAIGLLQEEPDRVARLRARARLFLELAQDRGLRTGNSHDTPIVPIIVGDSPRCIGISSALLAQGIDAQPILYPAVPEKASRIRFFITSEHTEEQIRRTVDLVAGCLT